MPDAYELSRNHRRIFDAVAEAMVGEPLGGTTAGTAERLIQGLAPADRRLLPLLLRLFEYGAPAFTARPRRFSELSLERRQACLKTWLESRIPLRRQAASALKALVMLAHYGREEAWPEVGYDGPWLGRVAVAVLPAPDLMRPTPDLTRPTSDLMHPRPHAARRARDDASPAPHNGPRSSTAAREPVSSEVPAETRDRSRVGTPAGAPDLAPGVTLGRDLRADLTLHAEVCVIGTGAGGAAALARLAELGVAVVAIEAGGHPTAVDFNQRELDMLPLLYQEAGLRATSDKAIGILQGRGVGGSTLHNTGLVYPPPSGIVQRWREEHGLQLDAPTMDRHIASAMDTLHATPIPAEQINPNNAMLQRGAEALGWDFRVALHNREECCGCGYCMLGCAYNRKYNAALTYLPRATAAGVPVLADAVARRIEGPSGTRRVVCDLLGRTGRPTGCRATIEAPVVLVAAGALDSPALLLRSRIGGDRIGRGLRLHPAALVAAVFPESVAAWRGLPQAVIIEEFATFMTTGRHGFIFIPIAGWPGLTAALVPGIGERHRAIMRDYRRLASAAVLLHDETAGRVSAARDGRPVARYWPDAEDRAELVRGIRALARLYLAAGASRVHLPFADTPPVHTERDLDDALTLGRPVPHRFSLNSVHPQGSCPLGRRRHGSAVDPYGEVWGERGVFVCDTSVFPTSVGVPPQVTTMAMARAVAEYVHAERL